MELTQCEYEKMALTAVLLLPHEPLQGKIGSVRHQTHSGTLKSIQPQVSIYLLLILTPASFIVFPTICLKFYFLSFLYDTNPPLHSLLVHRATPLDYPSSWFDCGGFFLTRGGLIGPYLLLPFFSWHY